jgi:hypothetical protein
MSNTSTGLWSALGAVIGGAAGAVAGGYAAKSRPRLTGKPRATAQEVEDAIMVGGATGAVVGAFVAGAVAGEPTTPQLTSK